MDAIDVAILANLQTDGRMSNRALADLVGLSPSACLERVKRLERLGVIGGYRAHINRDVLGDFIEGWAAITLTRRTPTNVEALTLVLRDSQIVVAAYDLGGFCDVLAHIMTSSMDAWQTLEAEIDTAIEGVSIRFTVVLATLKTQTLVPDHMLAKIAIVGE